MDDLNELNVKVKGIKSSHLFFETIIFREYFIITSRETSILV